VLHRGRRRAVGDAGSASWYQSVFERSIARTNGAHSSRSAVDAQLCSAWLWSVVRTPALAPSTLLDARPGTRPLLTVRVSYRGARRIAARRVPVARRADRAELGLKRAATRARERSRAPPEVFRRVRSGPPWNPRPWLLVRGTPAARSRTERTDDHAPLGHAESTASTWFAAAADLLGTSRQRTAPARAPRNGCDTVVSAHLPEPPGHTVVD
jgi:hypothetical protein